MPNVSPPVPLPVPLSSTILPAALHHAAVSYRQVVAYIDGERTFSFAETEASSRRLASALLASGLRRGDRIAVLSHNQIEWLQLFFAATRIGVAVVALSPRYRDSEIEYMLGDSQSKAVFTIAQVDDFDCLEMFARMRDRLPALQRVVAIDSAEFASMTAMDLDVDADAGALDAATAEVLEQDLARGIYSAGTTGRPKGCGLSHDSRLS